MLKCCTIASGSKGNCIFLGSDKTKLLVDMGINLPRLERALFALDVKPNELDGVFVTHTHADHICGLAHLVKKYDNIKIYCSKDSFAQLIKLKINTQKIVVFDNFDFFVGDFTVSTFSVCHDIPCNGYNFYCSGLKVSIATDLGVYDNTVLESMIGSDLCVIESNHDKVLLQNGSYPQHLKQRVMSDFGHLSNCDCARLVVELAKNGTKNFILAHLSSENNYPELAFDCVASQLKSNGFVEGKQVNILVALQNTMSQVIDLY